MLLDTRQAADKTFFVRLTCMSEEYEIYESEKDGFSLAVLFALGAPKANNKNVMRESQSDMER